MNKFDFLSEKQKHYLFFKRLIDIVLSGAGIIILSPVLLVIAIIIKVTSPGPILFKQKRVGINKTYFNIWKFRTMRVDTPKDMPTHLLTNPEQYITSIGKFLRKSSLDEIPQIFNIFAGKMSIIGPRPALYNQYDLIAERDKYHANDITPGLTGWAQINGRDELEIEDKARFDGQYVKELGFGMDLKCFFATIGAVLSSDGVVEGGTGEMKDSDRHIVSKDKINHEIKVGMAVFAVLAFIGILILIKIILIAEGKIEFNSEKFLTGFVSVIVAVVLFCIYRKFMKRH